MPTPTEYTVHVDVPCLLDGQPATLPAGTVGTQDGYIPFVVNGVTYSVHAQYFLGSGETETGAMSVQSYNPPAINGVGWPPS